MLLTLAGDHARLPAQSGPHRSQRLNRPSRSHLAISHPAADIDPRPGNRGHAIAGWSARRPRTQGSMLGPRPATCTDEKRSLPDHRTVPPICVLNVLLNIDISARTEMVIMILAGTHPAPLPPGGRSGPERLLRTSGLERILAAPFSGSSWPRQVLGVSARRGGTAVAPGCSAVSGGVMGEHIPGRGGGDVHDAVTAATGAEDGVLRAASSGGEIQDAVSAATEVVSPARIGGLLPGAGVSDAQPARRRRIARLTVVGVGVLAVAAAIAVVLVSSAHMPARPAAIFTNPGASGTDAVAFSSDGKTLATGGSSTYLWDVASGCRIRTLTDPMDTVGEVDAVAFSPGGKTLAASAGNGSIYLWDVVSGRRADTLARPASDGPYAAAAVAFRPGARTLAVGYGDGSTYLWDAATRQRISTLANPASAGVSAVAFSPDGKTLAAGDSAGRVYLWDVATGHRIATFTDPSTNGVYAVTFAPDGHKLAVGDASGSTYVWDVS